MKRLALALAAAVLLATAVLVLIRSGPEPSGPEAGEAAPADAPTSTTTQPLNQCSFYDEKRLRLHSQAEGYEADGLEIAIVPHYSPAMDLLAGVLAAVRDGGFQRVILLGPDHEASGSGISISGRGWSTIAGTLAGDDSAAKAILANTDIRAVENHDLLQQDHAVSALMPYIAEFLPDCAVVSVLINKYTNRTRLEALASEINALCDDVPTLVVFSVDFPITKRRRIAKLWTDKPRSLFTAVTFPPFYS